MGKTEELREGLLRWLLGSPASWADVEDQATVVSLAQAIVSTLGIRRVMVATMRSMSVDFTHEADKATNSVARTMWTRRAERCNITADIYAALLDLAESKP